VLGILGVLAVDLAAFAGAETSPGREVDLTLRLTATMLPFLMLICIAALLSGILQALRRFAAPAAMSILLNLCFLGAFWWIWSRDGAITETRAIFVVAGAVVLAGLLQVAIQWALVLLRGVRLRPVVGVRKAGAGKVARMMAPAALGLGVVQVNVLVDDLIAGSLAFTGAEGAITYLYLGNRLMQLPLGVFAIAVATTAFPFLARHHARGEHDAFLERLETSVRMNAFVMLPAAVGLAILAGPLVRMLFQPPDLSFPDAAVYRTSAVLAAYAAGLFFFSLQHLLTRGFYALGDTRTPVRIAVAMVAVNLVLNLILIHVPDPWRLYVATGAPELPGGAALGEAGLALATSLTAVLNVVLLWAFLGRRLRPHLPPSAWAEALRRVAGSLVRILLASALLAAGVYWTRESLPYEPELWMRIERGLVPVVVGVIGYVVLCTVIPVPELGEFIARRRKSAPPDDSGD
jgi:putative peptidoglycan lipid II flippase